MAVSPIYRDDFLFEDYVIISDSDMSMHKDNELNEVRDQLKRKREEDHEEGFSGMSCGDGEGITDEIKFYTDEELSFVDRTEDFVTVSDEDMDKVYFSKRGGDFSRSLGKPDKLDCDGREKIENVVVCVSEETEECERKDDQRTEKQSLSVDIEREECVLDENFISHLVVDLSKDRSRKDLCEDTPRNSAVKAVTTGNEKLSDFHDECNKLHARSHEAVVDPNEDSTDFDGSHTSSAISEMRESHIEIDHQESLIREKIPDVIEGSSKKRVSLSYTGSTCEDSSVLPNSKIADALPVPNDKVSRFTDDWVLPVLSDKFVRVSGEKRVSVSTPDGIKSTKPAKNIEVERKFVIPENVADLLTKLHATFSNREKFEDVYFDTPEFDLTSHDWWLRQRNGRWQLKACVDNVLTDGATTRYREYDDPADIMTQISFIVPTDSSAATMAEFASSLKAEEFARILTTRETYFMDGCTIVLDITDFGFRVGEIEVMVSDTAMISQALDDIDKVAKKLGFVGYGRGKLPLVHC